MQLSRNSREGIGRGGAERHSDGKAAEVHGPLDDSAFLPLEWEMIARVDAAMSERR